ncbi:accessory Sec system protein Asp2 [Weissella sagaensis]|uniref:accessory Sec system protein Asp2 n=1 Tax=Weissella sagaensis TaxID=2559928 RepID=UPI0013EB5E8E|nr:accessory Sec system protein Asp2 [Weissella sagaensis]
MINVLIAGSQATEYIFDDNINMYFHNENVKIVTYPPKFFLDDYENLVKFSIENEIDIVVFDLLFDVVKYRSKNENFLDLLDSFIMKVSKMEILPIYNSPRYVNRVIVDENWSDKSHTASEFISVKIQDARNKELDRIEDFLNGYNKIHILKFDKDCSALEYNKKMGFADLYFNQAYYLNQLIQFDEFANKCFDGFPVYLRFQNFDEIKKYIKVDNDLLNDNTIILLKNVDGAALAYQTVEGKNHFIFRELLKMDFIIDGSFGKTKRLIHRKNFYRSNLKCLNGIWYTEEINDRRLSGDGKPKRILFYFTPMAAPKWAIDNYSEQALPDRFKSLSRSLVKDTVLVRIADVNLTRGSYFMSSVNYPEYEKNIVEFINSKVKEYNVPKNNVVFYGFSRGGLGAIYYGKLLDYQVVSVDPVVNAEYFLNEKNDPHFLNGIRKISYIDDINNMDDSKQIYSKILLSNSGTFNKIFESSVLPLNTGKTIKKIDLKDTSLKWHGQIANQTVPESLALINQLLDDRLNI